MHARETHLQLLVHLASVQEDVLHLHVVHQVGLAQAGILLGLQWPGMSASAVCNQKLQFCKMQA